MTGAILGAYYGASQLPAHLVEPVLKTNKNELGIDIQRLAERLERVVKRR